MKDEYFVTEIINDLSKKHLIEGKPRSAKETDILVVMKLNFWDEIIFVWL